MDVNTLRIVTTVISFLAFLGIIGWALDRRKTRQFNEAALLPLKDD